MKKFILAPFFALFIISCSTEEIATVNEETASNALTASTESDDSYKNSLDGTLAECFGTATGAVYVDLPGGLGSDPLLTFVADTQGANLRIAYNVSIDFEALVDCEDLQLGNGSVTNYHLGDFTYLDSKNPSITLSLDEIPQTCYRWRFVFKNIYRGETKCTTYSQWYEAPLF